VHEPALPAPGAPLAAALALPVGAAVALPEGVERPAEADAAAATAPAEEAPPVTPPPPPGEGGGEIGESAAADAAGTAAVTLEAALERLTGLARARVRFAALPGERAPDPAVARDAAAGRRRAELLATSFLSGQAARARAIGGAAQAATRTIRAAATAARQRQAAAATTAAGELGREGGAAQAQARSAAAGARAAIGARAAATVARIGAATRAARARVDGAALLARAVLPPLEVAERLTIDRLYREGEAGFRATGRDVGERAMAIGRERAARWRSQFNYESSILDGPVHDERLEARAKAAEQVGAAYRDGLIEAANEEAAKTPAGKPKDQAAVGAAVRTSRDTIRSQQEAAHEALGAAETDALAAARRAARLLQGQLAASLETTLAGLSSRLDRQLAGLAAYRERQDRAIARDADRTAAALTAGAGAAAVGLAEPLAALVASAMGTTAPDPEQLAVLLDDTGTVLRETVLGVLEQLDTGGEATGQALDQGAGTVETSLAALAQAGGAEAGETAQSFAGAVEGLRRAALRLLAEAARAQGDTAGRTAGGASDGFAAVARAIRELFATIDGSLEQGFAQGATGLAQGLEKAFPEERQRIETEAGKAADQIQPRWKTVLKVVLVIAVIVVVAVVAGPAVIGAVGAAAGALGASAATAGVIGTVVGGALVGAASGATIQFGNNVIDGKDDLLEGVGKAAVVGAISGAFGGAGSALSGAGRFAGEGLRQVVMRGGIDLAFDVGGGIVADLAVGNELSWQGVLTGAAIGLGVSGASANLGRLGRIGQAAQGIQQRSRAAGEAFGGRVGAAAAGGLGIRPRVETPIPPPRPEPPAPRPEPEPPPAPRPEAEAPPPPRPEAEAPPPRRPEPEAPPAPRPEAEAPPPPRPEPEAPPAPRPEAEAPPAPRPEVEAPPAPRPEPEAPPPPRPETEPPPRPTEPERPRPPADEARITSDLRRQFEIKNAKARAKGQPEPYPDVDQAVRESAGTWAAVKERGYPNGFADRPQFEGFKGRIKGALDDLGLPSTEVGVHGSAVHRPNPNDIDVAVLVDRAQFDQLRQQMRGQIRVPKMLGDFDAYAKDGLLRGFYFPRKAGEPTFNQKIHGAAGERKVQVSIVLRGSEFDVGPYMMF
jgi:hypothetical protein